MLQTKENTLIPAPVKVLSHVRETEDGITMTLDLRMGHMPGQFVQMSLMGIGEAPISIASWAGDTTTFHVREVGNVTRAIGKLKAGDSIYVRGPYGNGFPMDVPKGKNLLLVGGGCGVAPVRGVLDYVLAHRQDYNEVPVYMGYRNPDFLLFEPEIDLWKNQTDLHISFDNMNGGCGVEATEGFVTEVVRATDLPPGDTIAFLCGPPIMMSIAARILKEKGLPEENIYLSMERLMFCGFGECCHCMIGGRYTCVDGPVFRLDTIKEYVDE